jgi:hypothetical protein
MVTLVRKPAAILKHATLLAALTAASIAAAQQPPVKSALLDHLEGKWTLQGPMAGRDAQHDVDAEWVLDHHYLQIHEISRHQNTQGKPDYQATIYIAWNDAAKQFAAVWLDDYGGLTLESIGVADPKPNELHFIFKNDKGAVVFSNDFLYDEKSDTWEWRLDNIVDGAAKPFGRVKLTRR